MDTVIEKIKNIYDYVVAAVTLSNISDVSNIFLNIATGVCAIIGIGYLRKLREKRNLSVFSFWQQIRVRIYEIASWLESDNSLVSNLYDPQIRVSMENRLTENPNRVDGFKNLAVETLEYIKHTPDQMPAYRGWTKDYMAFIEFLEDIVRYDINNEEKFFKFSKSDDVKIEAYCIEVLGHMKHLCNEIDKKQSRAEKKLTGRRR